MAGPVITQFKSAEIRTQAGSTWYLAYLIGVLQVHELPRQPGSATSDFHIAALMSPTAPVQAANAISEAFLGLTSLLGQGTQVT